MTVVFELSAHCFVLRIISRLNDNDYPSSFNTHSSIKQVPTTFETTLNQIVDMVALKWHGTQVTVDSRLLVSDCLQLATTPQRYSAKRQSAKSMPTTILSHFLCTLPVSYHAGAVLLMVVPDQAVHAPAQVPAPYENAYNKTIADGRRRKFAGMLSCMDEGR